MLRGFAVIKEALALAEELRALVRVGIIDKEQANVKFSKLYGIALYPVRKRKKK
jgi:hypothetical protein